MSLESLYPYAGDHAIQNAVFALDFDGSLSESQLKDVKKAAQKAYGSEFPDIQDQKTVAFNFGLGQGGQQVKAVSQSGGFTMQRILGFPGVPSRVITVNPDSCIIVINDYTRWAAIKSDIDRYFDVILHSVGKHSIAINSIGLQYTDVFNWKADPKELSLSEVFAAGNPYLVPHVLGQNAPMLWHSHHGYFLDCNEPVPYKQLDNINVSRVDAMGSHSLQVLTSHKAQLNSPMWKINKENRPKISEIQEKLHYSNKQILRALFTEELSRKIKLD